MSEVSQCWTYKCLLFEYIIGTAGIQIPNKSQIQIEKVCLIIKWFGFQKASKIPHSVWILDMFRLFLSS